MKEWLVIVKIVGAATYCACVSDFGEGMVNGNHW